MLRTPRVKRSTLVEDLQFGPIREGQFTITAIWDVDEHVQGKAGRYTRTYTLKHVGPAPCRLIDALIKEIMRARGVAK
jgi:hypothetical protein